MSHGGRGKNVRVILTINCVGSRKKPRAAPNILMNKIAAALPLLFVVPVYFHWSRTSAKRDAPMVAIPITVNRWY
jgi:hypothetical protein